jgi:uncharacterized protein YcbK (DUF882 family)
VLVGGARLKSCRGIAVRAFYSCAVGLVLFLCGSRVLQNAIAEGDTRTISLHHIHTDEDITITFKRDGQYDEAALEKLNWFLRDWRRSEQTRMDPHLIDLIWEVHRETGSREPIWVVCGYRSPETNAMLRYRSSGVARFSQHMLGHAMDFYIPGVPLEQLRVIGLRLQRGGVGFYPTSGSPFVHMDTGGVRHWPRMTREQLVRVFPDGRTVHIPADGRPLPGYALALADVKKRAGSPSQMSIDAAGAAGLDVADVNVEHHANPIAKLFGLARDDDDEDAAGAAANTPDPPQPLRTRAKVAVAAAIERAEDKLAVEKNKLVQVASRAEDTFAAEKTKLVQVASHAEDRLAAEKTKLAQVASKVHMIGRAEAAPLATVTPNQIILARGFWQGLPDGMNAAQPAQDSANPLAALPRPLRTELASANSDITESIATSSTAQTDRVPPELALAYAEQPSHEASTGVAPSAAATNLTTPTAAISHAVALRTGDSVMTIAMKRVSGRPASTILTVASRRLTTQLTAGAIVDDPWLRAVLLSPSVDRFLSVTALGAHDFRSLAALMVKPANSVMMTFAADPNAGLTHDHFSGSAIVFVSTVTYPMHTAELQ